ncbi:MAG: M15 family metallopeptidase [Bacilli bacterium]|nr:M15 family metallopeptidase [Bacilli bacterium]
MWNLILVNKDNYLSDNYYVDLTKYQDNEIDKRIYVYLDKMINDMIIIGLNPLIVSAYRTKERQEYLFNRKVRYYIDNNYNYEDAYELASKWVAIPNTSEHQTGLALDIVDKSYQELEIEQENTATQKWLMNNSYKYGFILRYPKDKVDITNVNYEPWHYRFVGDVAKEIYENNYCLEEYLIKRKRSILFLKNM